MERDPDTRREFERIIGFIPQALRVMASQVIAKASVDIARQRNALTVRKEDMVKKFLQYTPDAYGEEMLGALGSVGTSAG